MQFTKKHLFLVLAIFCTMPLFSQEKEKIAKLSYTLFRGGNADVPTFSNNGLDRNAASNFSVAFLLKNISKLKYQEFAFSRVFIGKMAASNTEISERLFSIKYEHGWIGAELNDFFELRLGGTLEVYHGKNESERPSLLTSATNYGKHTATGVDLSFSPHLDIDLNGRFFIDINPMLMLFYYEIENSKEWSSDPLPFPVRTLGSTTIELGTGGWVVQIGFGYKF